MVSDAEVKNQLVHPQLGGVEGKVVAGLVDRLDDELLVVKTYISDL